MLPFLRPSPDRALAENGFYRRVLSRALPLVDAASASVDVDWVCDIGCRNWTYLPAIAECFPHASIVGVEVTGRERLWNFKKRESHAQAQAVALRAQGRGARLVTADFREWREPGDLITARHPVFLCLYPFVSVAPAEHWGLSASFARFEEWLAHIRELCPAGATVISVHQGEWEAEIAREAFHSLAGVEPQEFALFPSEWKSEGYPQRFEARGFVARV